MKWSLAVFKYSQNFCFTRFASIVSKLLVLHADKDKAIPDIEQYKVNPRKLDNAPANSLAQARAVKESELLNSNAQSIHRELKKVLRRKRKAAQGKPRERCAQTRS